jgi:hypothetical protein
MAKVCRCVQILYLGAPLNNAVEAVDFRKMTVQGATLKAWRVTSKSSNAEMVFS